MHLLTLSYPFVTELRQGQWSSPAEIFVEVPNGEISYTAGGKIRGHIFLEIKAEVGNTGLG